MEISLWLGRLRYCSSRSSSLKVRMQPQGYSMELRFRFFDAEVEAVETTRPVRWMVLGTTFSDDGEVLETVLPAARDTGGGARGRH